MRKRKRMMCALLAAVLSVSALAPCSMPVYAQEMAEELTETVAEAEETAAELDTVLEAEGMDEVIPNDETGIPDKGLYQAILQELGKGKEDVLTRAEAESMEWFDSMGAWNEYMDPDDMEEIRSLKGIGYLKNLRSVDLEYYKLTSLDGIEELEHLKYLSVCGCLVSDLTALRHENMKSLLQLVLISNRLTSLEGTENLGNLYYLNVQDNRLTSLAGVEKLTNLTSLNVSMNKLTGLAGVEKLPKLEKLDASYNRVKKLPNLKKLDKLKYKTCDLTHNLLKEKEIRKKVPERFLKGGGKSRKGWLKDNTELQNLDYTVKFITPGSKKKITANTTKIVGKTLKNARVILYNLTYEFTIKSVKADKNGVFRFKNLDLRRYAGNRVEVMVEVHRSCGSRWEVVKSKKRVNLSKKKENVFVVKH